MIALLLSGELVTYLFGRYVEVKMLPLIFREYAHFCGLWPAKGNSKQPVLAERGRGRLIVA